MSRIQKKGVPVLYVRLSKALYGMLRATLLFYKRLRKDLKTWGSKLIRAIAVLANMVVNGAQCIVCWHVDDLKVSHMDEAVVPLLAQASGFVQGAGENLLL